MEVGISPVLKTEGFTDKEQGVMRNSEKIGVYSCTHQGRNIDQWSSICHAAIKHGESHNITNMVNAYKGTHPHAEEFLNFLTSFDGPFRDIMKVNPKGWTYLIGADKKIHGFCIPDDVMAFKPYGVVFAFLVCSRMPTEASNQVSTWSYLVNKGVNKTLAFIACQYLSLDSGKLVAKEGSQGWHGGHQAFVDKPVPDGYYPDYGGIKFNTDFMKSFKTRFLDTRALMKGEYHKGAGEISLYCSYLWSMKDPAPKALPITNFAWSGYCKTTKSSFTTMKYLAEENIIPAMEDFQKFLESRYNDKSSRSRKQS